MPPPLPPQNHEIPTPFPLNQIIVWKIHWPHVSAVLWSWKRKTKFFWHDVRGGGCLTFYDDFDVGSGSRNPCQICVTSFMDDPITTNVLVNLCWVFCSCLRTVFFVFVCCCYLKQKVGKVAGTFTCLTSLHLKLTCFMAKVRIICICT